MLVTEMKQGAFFLADGDLFMRIMHYDYTCVNLETGYRWNKLHGTPVTVRFEALEERNKVKESTMMIGTCFCHSSAIPRLKTWDGDYRLDLGSFSREFDDCLAYPFSHKAIVCS